MMIPQFDRYDVHDNLALYDDEDDNANDNYDENYDGGDGDDYTWLCRPPVNIAMEATLQKRSLVFSRKTNN